MARSTVDTLAADIQDILREYGEDVDTLTRETVQKIGKKGVEALRSSSSVFGGEGIYKGGWQSKVETTRFKTKATLYNARVPGLPHLLENGHAKRSGGRVPGRVHIKPVEDELIKAFESDLKEAIR